MPRIKTSMTQDNNERDGVNSCRGILQTYRELRFCIGRKVEIRNDKKNTVVGEIAVVTPDYVVIQLEHYKVTRLMSAIANKRCLFELKKMYISLFSETQLYKSLEERIIDKNSNFKESLLFTPSFFFGFSSLEASLDFSSVLLLGAAFAFFL